MKIDRSIRKIVDFTNAKDCFPTASISGGVMYFLWNRDRQGLCNFKNITNGYSDEKERLLDEYPVVVRYNKAETIINKVRSFNEKCITDIISSLMPFGLSTNVRGETNQIDGYYKLYASNGVTYIDPKQITKGEEYVGSYKVLVSKTSAEHAGEPSKDGKFRVIPTSMKVIGPEEVCTHSYFLIGNYDNKETAQNLLEYLKTPFVRFLVLMSLSGFGLSKLAFGFVPMQDFSIEWNSNMLYDKYSLTKEEVKFIESMIKPFE